MTTAFVNPISKTTYRLVIAPDETSWRITKSYLSTNDTQVIRHLRGTTGSGTLPGEVIDALVLGEHQMVSDVIGDPRQAFADVVISDLNGAYLVLAAMARNARSACDHGRPGFRPGCGALRRQLVAAYEQAADGCRAMARAWQTTGFVANEMPQWLTEALDDVVAQGSEAH